VTGGAAAVILVSFFFIFVHDVFTQSDHFKAKQFHVEGTRRLSPKAVLSLAGVRDGVNVLSVNLSAARRRLLAHPWIAEAKIQLEIPSILRIRIREHQPAAVVDIGKKFLLNEEGEIFKEWESADPKGLPVVTGLKPADLKVADRSGAAAAMPLFFERDSGLPPETQPGRPLDAVLQTLALGNETGAVLPNQQIRTIQVDRELGLTLIAFEEGKLIRLGYDDYPAKYRLLAELLTFLKTQPGVADFNRIDLTDVNRVIVNPVRAEVSKPKEAQGG
jgi:cell division protein FtsQ